MYFHSYCDGGGLNIDMKLISFDIHNLKFLITLGKAVRNHLRFENVKDTI